MVATQAPHGIGVTRPDRVSRQGESFDKYRLVARIGSGGMADVYLAVLEGPERFHRLVVVKRLRAYLSEDGRYRGMLLSEARLAARLHHPNIVQTFEVGEHQGCPSIAMEYLDGQPLSALVRADRARPGLLDPTFSALVVSEALAGLHHAHELCDYDGRPLSIVHRDVSPQNVFVTYAGEVKIVDFGIAKAASLDPDTDAGVLKGKLAYMAPEQARGEAVDRRADVFAMGVVLWELCTRERLFAAEGPVMTMNKVLAGDCPPPSSVAPGVASALDAICNRALDSDRHSRFQTAGEMRDAIEAWLASASPPGARRDLVARRMEEHFAPERAASARRLQAAMSSARERWAGGGTDSSATSWLEDAPMAAEELTRREVPLHATPPSLPRPLSSTPGPVGYAELPRADPPILDGPGRRWKVAAAVIGGGLAAAVAVAARRAPWQEPATTGEPTASAAVPDAVLAAPEVALRLCGSNTVGGALAPALAEAFFRQEGAPTIARSAGPNGKGVQLSVPLVGAPGRKALTIASEGSATAFEGLAEGTCDVGMSSRPIKPEEAAKLSERGLGELRSAASEHVIALDGIAVVVHPNNPRKTLTRADVKRIFTGEVADWSALGAAAMPITVQARDDASGTFDTFKHLVLGDQALAASAKRFADSGELSDAVAMDRGAIGFIGLAYIGNARPVALSDDGTPPTLPSGFTVTTESYLLSRRLFLYTAARNQKPAVLRFVRFVLSEQGQKVVREAGFVDLAVELDAAAPCGARCTLGYAARTRGARRISVDFRFRGDSLDLDSRAVHDLDRITAFLRDHAGGRLMLLGFSDDSGSSPKDLARSSARANVVAEELATRGVRAALVEGRGAEMPVASNGDESGREKNRRVEAWLVGER
jgi:phosphate transport system substrate-binding protein